MLLGKEILSQGKQERLWTRPRNQGGGGKSRRASVTSWRWGEYYTGQGEKDGGGDQRRRLKGKDAALLRGSHDGDGEKET